MNRNNYSWAINIDQINDYIDSNNTSSVNKIQEVKQSIAKKNFINYKHRFKRI